MAPEIIRSGILRPRAVIFSGLTRVHLARSFFIRFSSARDSRGPQHITLQQVRVPCHKVYCLCPLRHSPSRALRFVAGITGRAVINPPGMIGIMTSVQHGTSSNSAKTEKEKQAQNRYFSRIFFLNFVEYHVKAFWTNLGLDIQYSRP